MTEQHYTSKFCSQYKKLHYFCYYYVYQGWLHGTVVERHSLAGKLSLACAQPAADE